MKSMQKLDRRDPIAEFVAEELISAAALDAEESAHKAEIERRLECYRRGFLCRHWDEEENQLRNPNYIPYSGFEIFMQELRENRYLERGISKW